MNEQNLPAAEPEMFPKTSLEPETASPESPPRLLSSLPSLLELLQSQMEKGQATFQEALKAAGGGAAWLRQQCPRASSLSTSSGEIDLDVVVPSETEAFWRGVEVRLAECERCSPEGGACDKEPYRHARGRTVRLRVVGQQAFARESECEIYTEYRIAKRLEQVGVVRRLCRTKLNLIESTPRPHIIKAFESLVEAGKGLDAPRKFSLLMEGPRAREYGAAMMRTAVGNFQNAAIRSISAEAFVRECKEAMTLKQPMPVEALIEVDVLLIDNMPAVIKKGGYGEKELRWLYTQRDDQERATIITCTTPGAVKEAFPGVSVLRV